MASTRTVKTCSLVPLLLSFATSTLASGVPYYILAEPTPAAALLPALEIRQTSSPTSSTREEIVDPLVESCSSVIRSFLSVAPQIPESLADWLDENASGTCHIYPTTNIPASLTSALSSFESHGSSINCHESSLIEVVMSTCAELPQFSASIHPQPEGCLNPSPCGDGGDDQEDEEEGNAEDDNGSSDGENAASHLMDLGAAGTMVVGILVLAVL
jgi:hypothetical protein